MNSPDISPVTLGRAGEDDSAFHRWRLLFRDLSAHLSLTIQTRQLDENMLKGRRIAAKTPRYIDHAKVCCRLPIFLVLFAPRRCCS
jgi:hypothetical protein